MKSIATILGTGTVEMVDVFYGSNFSIEAGGLETWHSQNTSLDLMTVMPMI